MGRLTRPDHLDTTNIPKMAIAIVPTLIAASELVMTPLMHVDRSPPFSGPTLMVPCSPTLGRDSHQECPPGPRVSTQQRTSESWFCIHNREKKPNPTIAANNNPATVAGVAVANGRPATVRLLTAANQITNVAGRKMKAINEKVEKLATKDNRPTPRSSPPRTPGFRTVDAMRPIADGPVPTLTRMDLVRC